MKKNSSRFWPLLPAVCGLLWIKPGYVYNCMPVLSRVYDVLGIGSAAAILVLWILQKCRTKTIPTHIFLFAAFFGWAILTTLTGGFTQLPALSLAFLCTTPVYAFAFVLLADCFSDRLPALFSGLQFAFEVLIYGNLLTILLFPAGMNLPHNWLLGYDNLHVAVFLPAALTALLGARFGGRAFRVRAACLLAAILASAVLCRSVTSLLGLAAFLLPALLLPLLRKASGIFNFAVYAGVDAVLWVAVVVVRIQNHLGSLIEAVFQKDATLTGRIDIWDDAWQIISKRPVLGYGREKVEVIFERIGNYHMHNQILQYLYVGGAVLLVLFVVLNVFLGKELMRRRTSAAAGLMAAALFSFYLMTVAEAFSMSCLYLLFLYPFYTRQLESLETAGPVPACTVQKEVS